MPQPQQALLRSSEANIQLTISSLNRHQIKTERAAVRTFNVPRMTLRDRGAGKPARHDCRPNSKKLTQLEEDVIVRYILDLVQRGVSPTYAAIRDMADKLLVARGAGRVTLSSVQTVLQRVSINYTIGRELYAKILCWLGASLSL
jgi:hypothetical protein